MLIQTCGWVGDGVLLASLRRLRRSANGIVIVDASPSPWIYRNFLSQAEVVRADKTLRFERQLDAEEGSVVGTLSVADADGERIYSHRVRIYDVATLHRLVIEAGFDIVAIDADFEIGRAPSMDTRYAQLVCRPSNILRPLSDEQH